MHATASALLVAICLVTPAEAQINPVQRSLVPIATPRWDFADAAGGWIAQNQCELTADHGALVIRCQGNDPYLYCPVKVDGGPLVVRIRAKGQAAGPGELFWASTASPGIQASQSQHFPMIHDGKWYEYDVPLEVPGTLTALRLDPGTAEGTVEVDRIELLRPCPLEIASVRVDGPAAAFGVVNHGKSPIAFTVDSAQQTLAPDAATTLRMPIPGKKPLESVTLTLHSEGLPPVERTVFVHHPEIQTDWIEQPFDGGLLQVASDGSVARVLREGRLVAFFGPLVHVKGRIPALKRVGADWPLRLEGEGVTVELSASRREIEVAIGGGCRVCEGPVVRAVGELEQGLFAGLEYLGRGELSSSKLDIETSEHVRFAPDLDKVTMPLMVAATDRATVAVTWSNMELQPVYASPNFFDAAADHRMSLQGRQIEATVRIAADSLEEQVAWAVRRTGLPPLPDPPRTPAEQNEICLKALSGPLKTDKGWGHCVQENWARQPYADIASALWRLTGEVPQLPRLVPGGAHVRNDAIYFVTGRAQEWLNLRRSEAAGMLKQQSPDGSYHYNGEFRRGHFEDTASGICDRKAYVMLQFAQYTGDRPTLEAGLRTLDYLRRFRTPRGAQVWEVPLHTPDQLSSAYAVWANVLGYELTGKKEYLGEARRWALSGVPFTYLWSRYPVMLYATVPVLGATHWRHSWFGLPVQWVGGVYAYALVKLAPYDDTLDWKHLARGILVSAQQQQYPDGPHVGLLPDSFALKSQTRRPADINPCALVSLERVLDGQPDGLSVAVAGAHRVVAPFPVTIRDGRAHIQGQKGLAYQIVVDGDRIVDVKSQGDDVVPLE